MRVKAILITGSIALDTIEAGGERRENILGGSTTYATIAAGRNAPVHVAGIVGRDFPAEGLAVFQRFAANLTDLAQADGPTFRWGGRYHANGDERSTLFTELGVFATYQPVLSPANRTVPLVFLANIHPQLQLTVIRQCRPKATIVTDTMNLWIDTARPELWQVLARTTVLLINETEACSLSGATDVDTAGRLLLERGPAAVVVKRGSRGAVLFQDSRRTAIGVYPVKQVIDPTGAGDTFGGGFMAALAHGEDLVAAIVNGSALASLCVEDFGIGALVNTRPVEIERRKRRLWETISG